MPSETTRRNTRAQDIETLAATLKLDQSKLDKDAKRRADERFSGTQRRSVIRRMMKTSKRLDSLRAQSAVDDGIDEANRSR